MANTNDISRKLPRPRRKPINLCRICLTYSPSMRGLNENFDKYSGVATIQDVLEAVMCCEVKATQDTPDNVCSVCLSILKISYDFKLQFEDTQKKLLYIPDQNDTKTGREVDVIYGNNNYSLDDIVILENDEKTEDYPQLLNKLPKTVTVEYLGRRPNHVDQEQKHLPTDEAKCNSNEIVELEDGDYETIIIQYVSDTDEVSINQDQLLQINGTDEVLHQKDTTRISAYIIEDNSGEEFQEVSIENSFKSNSVTVNDSNSKNTARIESKMRKRKPTAEMMEIEKYIICSEVAEGESNADNQIPTTYVKKEECTSDDEEIKQNSDCNDPTDDITAYNHFCDKCSMSFNNEILLKRHLMYSHDMNRSERPEVLEDYVMTPEDVLRSFKKRKKTQIINKPMNQKKSEILGDYVMSPEDVLKATKRRRLKSPKIDQSVDKDQSCINERHEILEEYLITPEDVQKAPKRRRWKKPTMNQSINKHQRWREQFKKNPMLCQICGHLSKSSGGAKYHGLTHSEKRYKCDICSRMFYTPSHLKNHIAYLHEKNTKKHLCPVCGVYKNSPTALNYHMKLHRNDLKKYPCSFCNISFVLKGALKTHLRRHMGERRYNCQVCDKSFFTANEQKKHMMTHTGERPYKCNYCEKKFVTPFNQKIHMMTHTGPYSCKICYKGLADPEMLKLHVKYKHCWESKIRQSRLQRLSYAENEELVDATKSIEYEETQDTELKDEKFEIPQESPGPSSDNMIQQVLDLLDPPQKFDDGAVD